MSKKFDVAVFGEMMVLLIANEVGNLENIDFFNKKTAGAETNAAIALARLDFNVTWCSMLGNDSMGRYLLRMMEKEKVDCSHVQLCNGEMTGFMIKGKVNQGDPPIEYYRKGSAASKMGIHNVNFEWLKDVKHLHVTGIFPALSEQTYYLTCELMIYIRKMGGTISLDPNLRPSLWADKEVMKTKMNYLASLVDWILPGLEEGRLLTGCFSPEDISNFYHKMGVKEVVIKLGEDGAYFSGQGVSGEVPAYKVDVVVDTVGAGDGFAAGYISGRLDGLSERDSVARAAIIGACAVQVESDTDGYPTAKELEKLEATSLM